MNSEKEIVWLEPDIERFGYVREGWFMSGSKTSKPKVDDLADFKLLVGYTTIKEKVDSDYSERRRWDRRFFYLRTYDRYFEPEGVYKFPNHPGEAVDPMKVKVNEPKT